MSANFKLNGVLVKTPSSLQISYQDIDTDGTFRSLSGYMCRDRVRSNIVKLQVSWKYLTEEEAKKILNNIDGVFFEVSYFDPSKKSQQTKTMYVGDRTINVYSYRNGKSEYTDLSFNLIER